ncbi:MAG: c-type cytochrome, partial [Pirellulaceae bacterium]|nr:c-type cytochrome [Pirellulaceae bacterium]
MNWRSMWIMGLAFSSLVAFKSNALIASAEDKPSNPATQQLFTHHCQKCHSGTKPKGEFNIESLSQDFTDKKNREKWLAVLEQLNAESMPPKEEPRPPAEKVKAAVQWISERAGAAEIARRA